MSCMPDRMPTSFVAAAAPRTVKFIKNGRDVFERWKKLGKLKTDFFERGLAYKVYEVFYTLFLFREIKFNTYTNTCQCRLFRRLFWLSNHRDLPHSVVMVNCRVSSVFVYLFRRILNMDSIPTIPQIPRVL